MFGKLLTPIVWPWSLYRRFVEYLRWRQTEEGHQTRLFDKEVRKLFNDEARQRKTEGWRATKRLSGRIMQLHKKYPNALQVTQCKIESGRPNYISEEEWDRMLCEE
jgi:hypothetical protein